MSPNWISDFFLEIIFFYFNPIENFLNIIGSKEKIEFHFKCLLETFL